jgi:uncharacterized protein (TIGR03435 family)
MHRLLIVAAAGFAALAAGSAPLRAQSAGATFEVASVKPSNPNAPGLLPGLPGGMPMVMPPLGGRFTATNVPLRLLVRMAYGLQDFQLIGGPDWQMSQKFDINAKVDDPAALTNETMLPMLKALLAERFKLKVHTETREVPTYALVVARGDGRLGPNVKPSMSDCSNQQELQQKLMDAFAKGGLAAAAAVMPRMGERVPCSLMPVMPAAGGNLRAGIGMRGDGQTLAALAQLLTQIVGRPVVDRTGLSGLYDFEITFDPQVMLAMASQAGINLPTANLPQFDSPSLMTALQQDLGLKLDSQRGPGEVLVIDSAEMPTPD